MVQHCTGVKPELAWEVSHQHLPPPAAAATKSGSDYGLLVLFRYE
jgi:hypothetical protein